LTAAEAREFASGSVETKLIEESHWPVVLSLLCEAKLENVNLFPSRKFKFVEQFISKQICVEGSYLLGSISARNLRNRDLGAFSAT